MPRDILRKLIDGQAEFLGYVAAVLRGGGARMDEQGEHHRGGGGEKLFHDGAFLGSLRLPLSRRAPGLGLVSRRQIFVRRGPRPRSAKEF